MVSGDFGKSSFVRLVRGKRTKLASELLKWGKEWVVMYECESWIMKKAECRRIDAFELWCWGRLLRVPWTARRSNQSILKEINPEYSLEVLMLKLKLQYFGHLRRRANSLETTLMLGKTEGRRRGGQQGMRWLASLTWIWTNSGRWWRTGKPGLLQSMGSQRVGHDWLTPTKNEHINSAGIWPQSRATKRG